MRRISRMFLVLVFFSLAATVVAQQQVSGDLNVAAESAPPKDECTTDACMSKPAFELVPNADAAPITEIEADIPVATPPPAETAAPTASVPRDLMEKASDDTTVPSRAAQQGKIMPPPPPLPQDKNLLAPTRYSLGPDDVIEIVVRRHPEFSGQYVINGEGKIQIKFVDDIEVKGMTKTEVEELLTDILKKFIIDPDVDVSILQYRSKVIYVIGEVGAPGKYYMKSDEISLREAVVIAGLPTLAAAMRRTALVRPDKSGKPLQKSVDLYALLYEGKLNLDLTMIPGDVVYVPATMFAKIMRIVNPVAGTVSEVKTAAYIY